MSHRETVPGRLRRLTAALRPALGFFSRLLAASARARGDLPPAERRTVCLVRAIAAGGRCADEKRGQGCGGSTGSCVGGGERRTEVGAQGRRAMHARPQWARRGQTLAPTTTGGGGGDRGFGRLTGEALGSGHGKKDGKGFSL